MTTTRQSGCIVHATAYQHPIYWTEQRLAADMRVQGP